jgi:hypothetical protein
MIAVAINLQMVAMDVEMQRAAFIEHTADLECNFEHWRKFIEAYAGRRRTPAVMFWKARERRQFFGDRAD